ncbi:MAG: NAD(P)/FAD-dependent oxidoreductase [Anaerolineae bacterium]
MDKQRKRVVILGAGFGGLWAARTLANAEVDVLVIDRNNYHTFLPLLYQVAAAEVGVDEIAAPVRKILGGYRNVDFSMEYVQQVDLDERVVHTTRRDVSYDYLVMALGSRPFYFGVRGAAEYAFALKDIEQAVALRNHILTRLEQAALEPDPEVRKQFLTFTIVGGGPTGVEFAGALAELMQGPIKRDHKRLNPREIRIVLLEAQSGLMRGMPNRLGDYTLRRLQKMGVEVKLQASVSEITPEAVYLASGEIIPTRTVVWTAGVRAEPVGEASRLPTARNGQVIVMPTLQVEGHPEVYVIGDSSRFEVEGAPLPMLAPVAIQGGTHAARNIQRQLKGLATFSFQYKDPGTMATIGRNHGVATIHGFSFTGLPAWFLWVGVHIVNLIGFRNRVAVLMSWAVDYFLYEREVRLILPGEAEPMRGSVALPQALAARRSETTRN